MRERADYYIEKVRYNKDHTRIVWVSVREDSGSKLGGPYNMVRKQIVGLLQQGKRFMTIFRSPEGKYRKGESLGMVHLKGVDYLRTDKNEVEQDQLSDLPEY